MERGPDFLGAGLDDGADGRVVAAEDDGDAGLDDSGLLRGDLLHRVAEPVAVVEPDLRDDAKLRLADVRRVEAPPEPALENRVIDLRLGAKKKRDSGEGLKECNVRMFECSNVRERGTPRGP